jgi:hypothetical protein
MKMERRKELLAILTITLVSAAIIAPIFLIRPVTATDPSGWYMNVSGVLDSDYYSLYPFEDNKSINFGFSKFGELIDSINNVGLEYGARDSFAPPAGATVPTEIAKKKWMSGWLINITYQGTSGRRNVWAVAQHADLIDYGKDWIRVNSNYNYSGALTEAEEDPRDVGKFIGTGVGPVNGGRKTNGTAVTEDILVLYNGPRMFIARTVTHIYDWDASWSEDEELVDVVFTFIFDKVQKEVIVLKDIKECTTKFVFGQLVVPIAADVDGESTHNATVNGAIIQFSNRGEWDIGPANTYDSYVHFYVAGGNPSEGQSTVYDVDYHLNPTLHPAAWLGISTYGYEPTTVGTYDVAQIVASDRAYAGWAAFWPSLSDWHVDAGYQDKWWKSLMRGEDAVDSGLEPFMSPYLIGEWDFVLTKTPVNATDGVATRHFDRQFRGVTVYGLTDNWIGDDHGRTGGSNVIDREVRYQLEEVFNPWDLYAAIHKDTRRWVEFHTVTAAEKEAALTGTNLSIALSNKPVKYVANWDSYCYFSECVEWGGALKHPARSVWIPTSSSLSASEPYELSVNSSTGVGNVTIRAASVPVAGTIIKILYSTECTINYTEADIRDYYGGSLSLGNATRTGISADQVYTLVPYSTTNSTAWTDLHDIVQNVTVLYDDFAFNISGTPSEATLLTRLDDLTLNIDIKIPPEGGYIKVYNSTYFAHELGSRFNVTYNGNMSIMYAVNPPDTLAGYEHEYVHITGSIVLRANHTLFYDTGYNVTSNYTIASASLTKEIMGRYEWAVVGNHSRAIDSVGAAMVSEAFKEKQVVTDNGGLDMMDMWGTNIPYLLADLGNATWRAGGPAWTDIYDSKGRLAYVDDWCTRYPVSTSNIITVAGPSANLFSEYFNEFSQAIQIYGITSGNLIDVIFATTCWNTTKASNYLGQYYYSNGQFTHGSTGTGIGVVTTYKDINGTVGFMIYGWSGDDTYYTCKWFQEYGIYYLQTENRGVTTLIVRLDYNQSGERTNPMPPNYSYDSHNPSVTILERLGTISEKTPHDP